MQRQATWTEAGIAYGVIVVPLLIATALFGVLAATNPDGPVPGGLVMGGVSLWTLSVLTHGLLTGWFVWRRPLQFATVRHRSDALGPYLLVQAMWLVSFVGSTYVALVGV